MKSTYNRDVLGPWARRPRWCSNTTEYALEKAGAPGMALTPHVLLLQLLQPLEGVVELAIRAATRGIKPLRVVRFECPKMTGINPLQGIIELKSGMGLGLRWKKLNEENW